MLLGIFNFCKENNSPSAVSVCEVNKHPYLMYHRNKSFNLKPFIKNRPKFSGRQDFNPLYITNGALYLAKVEWLLKKKNFISNGDDYQILFTANGDKSRIISNTSKKLGIKISKIGKITSNKHNSIIIDQKGRELLVKKKGYKHEF